MKKIGLAVFFLAAVVVFSNFYLQNQTQDVNGTEGIKVPALMYHHFLEIGSLLGDYAITPAQFEQDLQYIQAQGFQTVTVGDLIDFVQKGTPLPEKPIMITIDDGYEGVYAYAYPLLKKYHMKATFSIIGRFSDFYSTEQYKHINYSHCTWQQIQEMHESGVMEFQNHSYNFHSYDEGRRGILRRSDETLQEYTDLFTQDCMLVQQKLTEVTGETPLCYTYPFGFINDETEAIVRDLGFVATLSCEEGMNVITRDPACLWNIKRYNRPYSLSTGEYFQKVLK